MYRTNIILALSLIIASLLADYSLANNSTKKTKNTDTFEALAKELEQNYSLTPDQASVTAEFDQELKKYKFAAIEITDNGRTYSAPALPFDTTGLLLLPNIMLAKDQVVTIFKGDETEQVKPFYVSRNNYTILKSKLYENVSVAALAAPTIKSGQSVVSFDLTCKSQCKKTYGVILMKMEGENVYADIHLNYPSKRDFKGAIFNTKGDLLGFNTIKLDAAKVDVKYDRDIYFLITVSELITSMKEEIGRSQKLN